MDERERHARGEVVRRTVLGDAHVDRSNANASPLNNEFNDLITRYAWGEIWTRPGLDLRTRRVLVIGTLIALGRWDELRMHMRAAILEGGFAPEDVKEVVLQQAVYCGVPTANAALRILRDLVDGGLMLNE